MMNINKIYKETPYSSGLNSPVVDENAQRQAVAKENTQKQSIANEHSQKQMPNKESETAISQDQKRRFKILLAEDNPINRQLALTMLRKIGYNANAVINGKEALKALVLDKYDLLLMDCQMPEMDGYEATKKIRQGDAGIQNVKIPVIAMTANSMQEDREKCLESGMDDYISKPVHHKTIEKILEKWLSVF
ncbi:MAG: response regulator [Desulfamplus sp.]|nr:response regulator [Desulfamplus sp.]